jgi:hypothetical protein
MCSYMLEVGISFRMHTGRKDLCQLNFVGIRSAILGNPLTSIHTPRALFVDGKRFSKNEAISKTFLILRLRRSRVHVDVHPA